MRLKTFNEQFLILVTSNLTKLSENFCCFFQTDNMLFLTVSDVNIQNEAQQPVTPILINYNHHLL